MAEVLAQLQAVAVAVDERVVDVEQGGDQGGGGDVGDGEALPRAERGQTRPRVSPVVPGPDQVVEPDPDGWKMIHKVGAWKCIISQFRALDEVPAQYRAVWVWAWGEILRRTLEAEEGSEELDRCLMWFLFLPQALCRKPEGRGGSRGRGFINRRFNALSEGKWGELVRLWEVDVEKAEGRMGHGGRRDGLAGEGQAAERKKREVLKLLAKGQIHRAVDRINSFGVASLSDPQVRQQVLDKHPPPRARAS